jgi:hypothetical protein
VAEDSPATVATPRHEPRTRRSAESPRPSLLKVYEALFRSAFKIAAEQSRAQDTKCPSGPVMNQPAGFVK